MPRTHANIAKIRAELAWVNEPVDPSVCGCRHVLCGGETGPPSGGGLLFEMFNSLRTDWDRQYWDICFSDNALCCRTEKRSLH
jgi:hypothetical protein